MFVNIMETNLWMLGILDSYHDFEDDTVAKKLFNSFKKYYCSVIQYNDNIGLMKLYRNYFDINTDITDVITNDTNNFKQLKGTFSNGSNKFEQKVFNNFINAHFELVNIKSRIELNEVKLTIISNFKQIFSIKTTDEQILNLRIPLYWLIFYCKTNKNSQRVDGLINFFKHKLKIKLNKNQLVKNCKLIQKNITYPIVFTSDMNIKETEINSYHINEYPYQLVNWYKKNIDGASTLSKEDKILETANIPNLYDNSNLVGKLMLTIPEQTDDLTIDFAGVKYYFLLDEKQFVCEFDDIYLKVPLNNISSISDFLKFFNLYLQNNKTECNKKN